MFQLIYFVLMCLLKLIFYLFLLFIVAIIGLRLWLEPVKGVCKCTAKLNGRVALVTGGNSGIGLETAKELARRGARVIIASRDAKKYEKVISDIIEKTGNTAVEYKHLDLSKFSSVKRFAEEFNKNVDRLDVLVNNAGVAGLKPEPTEDGIDKVMQINYLGQFLLTNLLLNKIIKSRPSRIVIVSSIAHYFAKFDPQDLAGLKSKGFWTKYCNSKLCEVLWTRALAKKLPNGVTANVLHPGFVKTNIFDKLPSVYKQIIFGVIDVLFKTSKEGAQTTIHLSVAPELENATGGYYSDCKPSKVSKLAKDDDLAETVWKESLRLIENL